MDELLIAIQQENTKEQAFKTLVATYQKPLYYHIRRMTNNHDDANDILQNVFIKVYKNSTQFKGDSSLYTWIFRIATNETLTFINKNKKHLSVDISQSNISQQTSVDSDNTQQIEQKLAKALAQLPDKQKQVFVMRYYDEMPYEQMSEILETSVGALKASYHHAAKKIEEFILSH
ncbi:MAG: sigma-70 family RNA polymerase sigma factor [Chitinophagales bacterium]|nr:sigma-70 family RNA polymerase sigma factor [Chitinophagales bacterium]